MVTTGLGLTLTVVVADVAEHPAASVTVTEKLPGLLTVIACVVAPLLHDQELPADAVSTTFPPWQKLSGPPALIVATGKGFTVTSTAGDVLVQPLVVTVTV
jgi:hypothetical protein